MQIYMFIHTYLCMYLYIYRFIYVYMTLDFFPCLVKRPAAADDQRHQDGQLYISLALSSNFIACTCCFQMWKNFATCKMCRLRYRVPIKQEIDENDTGHYEGRIVDKRIGGQDCATVRFERVAREKRELVAVHTTSYSGDHPPSSKHCSVEHAPTHTGNTGIMIVGVIAPGPRSRTVSPSSNWRMFWKSTLMEMWSGKRSTRDWLMPS